MMQGPRFRMIRSKAFGDLSELKDETEFKIDYRIPFKIDYKIDSKSSEEVSSEEDAEDVSSEKETEESDFLTPHREVHVRKKTRRRSRRFEKDMCVKSEEVRCEREQEGEGEWIDERDPTESCELGDRVESTDVLPVPFVRSKGTTVFINGADGHRSSPTNSGDYYAVLSSPSKSGDCYAVLSSPNDSNSSRFDTLPIPGTGSNTSYNFPTELSDDHDVAYVPRATPSCSFTDMNPHREPHRERADENNNYDGDFHPVFIPNHSFTDESVEEAFADDAFGGTLSPLAEANGAWPTAEHGGGHEVASTSPHLDPPTIELEDPPKFCPLCNKKFSSSNSLVEHYYSDMHKRQALRYRQMCPSPDWPHQQSQQSEPPSSKNRTEGDKKTHDINLRLTDVTYEMDHVILIQDFAALTK